jgi:hypothetical protein
LIYSAFLFVSASSMLPENSKIGGFTHLISNLIDSPYLRETTGELHENF